MIPSCFCGNSPLLNRIQSEWKELLLGVSTILSIAAFAVSMFNGAIFVAFGYALFTFASMVGFRAVKQVKVLKPLEETVTLLTRHSEEQQDQINQLKTTREQLENTREELNSEVSRLNTRINQIKHATDETMKQITILDSLIEKSRVEQQALETIRRKIEVAHGRLEETQTHLESTRGQLSDVVNNFESLQAIIRDEIKQLIAISKEANEASNSRTSEQSELLEKTLGKFNKLLEQFDPIEQTDPSQTRFPRFSTNHGAVFETPPPQYSPLREDTREKSGDIKRNLTQDFVMV